MQKEPREAMAYKLQAAPSMDGKALYAAFKKYQEILSRLRYLLMP